MQQSLLDNPPPSISEAKRLVIQTIMEPEATSLAA